MKVIPDIQERLGLLEDRVSEMERKQQKPI